MRLIHAFAAYIGKSYRHSVGEGEGYDNFFAYLSGICADALLIGGARER